MCAWVSQKHFCEPHDYYQNKQNFHWAERQVEVKINVAQSAEKEIKQEKYSSSNAHKKDKKVVL